MNEPKPGEFYRHFKGGLYRVIAVGVHTETNEELVCYVHLSYGEKFYFRPLSMWEGIVDYKGEKVKRFTKVQETGYPINTHFPTIYRKFVDLSHTLKIDDE